MARNIKQISTCLTNDCFLVTALCEDNSVWVSVDWKAWEKLDDIPDGSLNTKEGANLHPPTGKG